MFELEYRRKGFRRIAGVDEVGRGPLAGPVVAAACLIPEPDSIEGVRDSKALSAKNRQKLFWSIIKRSLVGVGVINEREIDRLNILQASLLAMREAVLKLPVMPDLLLIDGPFKIDLPIEQIPIIGGDAKVVSIGAASIVAKVTRDAIMDNFGREYPEYGFHIHKGYGTSAHLAALEAQGPSPIHRMSFRPVAEAQLKVKA
jgi:ribonuclease HII